MRTRELAGRAAALALALSASCSAAGPTQLASSDEPWGIAVHAGTVYWVDASGTVMSVPAGGGTAVTLASGQSRPSSIAVDDSNVYWTNAGQQTCMSQSGACGSNPDGSLVSLPLAGGAPKTLASGLCGPDSIAVDTNDVYFADGGDGMVGKVAKTGGNPVVIASAQTLLGSIAVDATSVYWTATDAQGLKGSVLKAPTAGGAATVVASGWFPLLTGGGCGTITQSLAVDGAHAYWATGSGDVGASVLSAPVGGGAAVTLAMRSELGEGAPGTLAIDGTNVYWSDGQAFHKTPLGGGDSPKIAVFDEGIAAQPGGFALDAQNLYWTGPLGVWSTPKSP